MRKQIYILTIIFIIVFGCDANANIGDIKFRRLDTTDGLSNSQVNYVFKDSHGFMWFATASGLDRYDGFRFKTFYSQHKNLKSILDNNVDNICEDAEGYLWIHTSRGYCVFNPRTETFERDMNIWLKKYNIHGNINNVYIDNHKNIWVVIYGQGCYFISKRDQSVFLFKYGKSGAKTIPEGNINSITEFRNSVLMSYNDGKFISLNGHEHRRQWTDTYISKKVGITQGYNIFTDRDCNYYICTNGNFYVYMQKTRKWYSSLSDMLRNFDIIPPSENILVKNIKQDKYGNLWIATDHKGVIVVNLKLRYLKSYYYDKDNINSIPDNTQQSIFIDNNYTVWIGTYKNGVAYYSDYIKKFQLLALGDITSMSQDKSGLIWCGSNDNGILSYNPITNETKHYGREKNKLQSDIIVCCKATSDGSIWFGSYNGGLTRYKNGEFTPYRYTGKTNGLANKSVWSLEEDSQGNIWIGTLGSGLQCLNPKTGKFITYNSHNSGLASDYLSSLSIGKNHDLVIGHSVNFSIMDLNTHKIKNYSSTRDNEEFSSGFVNQIFVDSRGLIWNGTSSGMNVYDLRTDQLTILDRTSGLSGSEICSVTEDVNHNIWLSTDKGVSNIKVYRNEGKWDFTVYSFNEIDGLQNRQFNQRSILQARNGDIYIGGQDGVNVVSPNILHLGKTPSKAVFSGLVVFDHLINVNEKFNGHVILKEALNESKKLVLDYDDKAFTIQMASSNCTLPENTKFLYKLEGFNDKWMQTVPSQAGISFTNLSPGVYKLLVKVVNGDGYVNKEVSSLDIIIRSPFYSTIWAYMLYAILIAIILWYIRRFRMRRQEAEDKIRQVRIESEKKHEIDDMKLRFFTNVSHELRTPLTLIISPIISMIKDETDDDKRRKLMMIHRNSERLLTLVNQLLDFRRADMNKLQLNLLTGDIINFLSNICNSFLLMAEKKIHFSFKSSIPSLRMSFDDDKISKIMNNLLSNAFKFTPEGGSVSVTVNIKTLSDNQKEQAGILVIKIMDTGIGVSDNDKQHIFDRFYQVDGNHENSFGGSGVGLNLVKDFVEMHGGNVYVEDNPGGGCSFFVEIPIRHDSSLKEIINDTPLISIKSKLDDNDINKVKEEVSQVNKEYEVLIADDSDDFLEFMNEELSRYYKVRLARDGREAYEMIKVKKPDIILSDVMMPEINGNELCRMLKADPDTEGIPFMMLTARLADEHKVEGMESGADDYITKPFNLDLLNLRINNLIKWHNSSNHNSAHLQPHIKDVHITSLDEKLIQKATDYVEQNLSDTDLTVEQLSSILNMSRVHLYKKMLSITGKTPSEFIRTIRLKYAERLLCESQLSVSEISYQVGFNNPRYFSKYFKEMYGDMPSHYKEKNGK
jgi:signal transduction histidine kinase/ligand-binding sensor domain-containing protein/DNA-binding response OmpR family regulator